MDALLAAVSEQPATDIVQVDRIGAALSTFIAQQQTDGGRPLRCSPATQVQVVVRALIPLMQDEASGLASDAALALRLLSRTGTATEDFCDESFLLSAGRAAGLSKLGLASGWSHLAREASILLNNILVIRGNAFGVGAALPLRSELRAEEHIAAALSTPDAVPLGQLVAWSRIAFRLTLLPPAADQGGAVGASARLARVLLRLVGWVAKELHGAERAARTQLLCLCENAARSGFNCLRSLGDAALAASAAEQVAAMLAVEPVADAPSATPAGEDAPLREAQLAALQLVVAAPGGGGATCLPWRAVVSLLPPLLRGVSERPGDRRLLVPLLAAQRVAEADKAAAAEMREALFPEAEDGGGVMGRDPNAPLGESAPLGALLVQQLCSSDTIVKRAVGEMVLAVCGGDVDEFVGVAGVGNSAGLLAEKGLLGAAA